MAAGAHRGGRSEEGNQTKVKNRCGTPQGGVISPLLANLYLDGLDKAVNGGRQMKAVMVRLRMTS